MKKNESVKKAPAPRKRADKIKLSAETLETLEIDALSSVIGGLVSPSNMA